jgi:glycosyltransferase involved in cell wall biosynthesis
VTRRDRQRDPALSVVIPTFNNVDVLARNLECWRIVAADQPIEVIVVADGCRDRTAEYLQSVAASEWGARHLRWHHQDDLHELRCTNCGLRDARAPLAMAWQDDMLLRVGWLVPEIMATFAAYSDLGLLCLSRGLDYFPLEQPIASWEDLIDERRLRSTIGPPPLNWFLLQEVDSVIRPWVVRRACLDAVGFLDEAFVPTEWDEADLSFRIRRAGWKIATHGYERVGAYQHLGSTTIGALSDGYKTRVLRNGRLFHERWDDTIRRESARRRKTWRRQTGARGWWWTASRAVGALASGGRRRAAAEPD